ncbi:MAG: prepilin-type N-terminal cleavage/methylation domain-containing protein [Candidatus Absconditabacterales bacterium]
MKFSRRKGPTMVMSKPVHRKSGFTIWEVLVVVVVISIGILAIVALLTYGFNFVQKSRQNVVAINLAREGVEAVYQIRDTNRRRWSGSKDACRLKTNPLLDEGDEGCANDSWMSSGFYILDTNVISGQHYFLLTGPVTEGILLSGGITSGDLMYSLCQSGSIRSACPGLSPQTAEGNYFREIHGYGLYQKDVPVTGGLLISCPNGQGSCGFPTAKEYRFCSRVVYVGYGTGEVELCGLLTNFLKE